MTEALPRHGGALAQSDANKKASEIQAAMVVAKKFPRDQNIAYRNILESCKRKSLAEVSTYQYPRGGATVKGPSIRMAEMLAQQWGNMEFGVREIERTENESTVEAFAWDLETNVKRSMQFQVRHVRDTRQGSKKLTDERDIYEMVANQGARRLRACILNVIPGDITESALEACYKTLAGGSTEPLKDRVRKMVSVFGEHGITQAMIVDRLGHDLEAITEAQLHELRGIFTSIKDGQSSREDWFEVKGKPAKQSEPEDGDDTDLAPSKPKTTERKLPVSKGKNDNTPLDDEPQVIDPLISQVFDVLGDHIEAATDYAIGQEWIKEGQSLEDLRKPHAKAILSNPESFIKTISKS